jgi:hypothetical protein
MRKCLQSRMMFVIKAISLLKCPSLLFAYSLSKKYYTKLNNFVKGIHFGFGASVMK